MDSLGLLATAASGMDAQRAALDVEARNVAAAEAAGPKGSYPRLIADFRLVQADGRSPQVVYAGAHVDRGSSVDVLTEMVAVLNATRAYEANASVFDAGKRLAERTIDMGKLMRIENLLPDAPETAAPLHASDASAFGKLLDDLGSVFTTAQGAEDAFASGAGDLQTAVYERARADVALSVASAAAGRTAQALTSILNMQV